MPGGSIVEDYFTHRLPPDCKFAPDRLIGTIRREYLDRMFFWNAVDLARKMGDFKAYYNGNRCHQSLSGGTPS